MPVPRMTTIATPLIAKQPNKEGASEIGIQISDLLSLMFDLVQIFDEYILYYVHIL